jgi:hypothetical protein
MAFTKGSPKPQSSGRMMGTPNKATRELREMVRAALDEVGGVEYLAKQARENPTAFLTLVGKLLPHTLAGDRENPLQVEGRLSLAAIPDELLERYRVMIAEKMEARH